MRTPLLLTLAGALLAAATAAAQPPLSCEARTDIIDEGTPRLVAYRPSATMRATLERGAPWRFGPFDSSVFGFDRADIYLHAPGPFDDSFMAGYGPVDVVVRLHGATDAWFKLDPGDGYGRDGSFRGPRSIEKDRTAVRLATPDPHLPLFVITLGEGHPRGQVTEHHLLDLRPGRKRVPVVLECRTAENQGACGTWDHLYQSVGTHASCEWDPRIADFRCRMTAGITTTWGTRESVWQERLLGTEPFDRRAFDETIRQLRRHSATGVATLAVPTALWGNAYVLERRALPGGGSYLLVGLGGRSTGFDARFLIVRLDARGRATPDDVTDVPQLSLGPKYWDDWVASEADPASLPGRPTPDRLVMSTSVLFRSPDNLIVLRVHVREGRPSEDGSGSLGQAVYWVGIETAAAGPSGSALRVATDTYDYFRCGRAATPPNVITAMVEKGPDFTAHLDIEPAHQVDLFSGEPSTDVDERSLDPKPVLCPTRATTTWRSGFVVTHERPAPCASPARARFVRIDDDGVVHVVDRPVTGERAGMPPLHKQ